MHRAVTTHKKISACRDDLGLKESAWWLQACVSLMVVINEILNVTNATYIFIVFTNTYSDHFFSNNRNTIRLVLYQMAFPLL